MFDPLLRTHFSVLRPQNKEHCCCRSCGSWYAHTLLKKFYLVFNISRTWLPRQGERSENKIVETATNMSFILPWMNITENVHTLFWFSLLIKHLTWNSISSIWVQAFGLVSPKSQGPKFSSKCPFDVHFNLLFLHHLVTSSFFFLKQQSTTFGWGVK